LKDGKTARKRYKPEEIVAKLRPVVLTAQRKSIAEAVKTIAVTASTKSTIQMEHFEGARPIPAARLLAGPSTSEGSISWAGCLKGVDMF
jgi:hypothetical protein